jgi:ABC-type branched-subunit amino acid transport system substrate-binding protein
MAIRKRLVTALVAVAALVAACGGSDSGSKEPAAGSKEPDTGTEARTASDVGVTADTIKVGFVLTDLAQTKKLLGDLGADAPQQQAAYQAFVDEANDAGGIGGRRIEPVFTSFDPVSGDATVACNKMTEDEKVFAVMSVSLFGAPVLCITQQHQTPLLNIGGFANEYYEKSGGLLYTMQPAKPRSARNTIAALEQRGDLQGKTIGIFTSQAGDDDVAVKTAMVPTLDQLGHEVAHVADLAVDSGTAIGQVPVEVTQMRDAHVDLVFLSTNAFFSGLFVQKADEQGYRPTYALSDADDNIGDFFVERQPASFVGVGFTALRTGDQRDGSAEPKYDEGCRSVVEAAGTTLERGSTAAAMALGACNQVRLFAKAAEAAGAELTRTGWAKEMQGVGSFTQANGDKGSFSATKFDAADYIRPVEADMTCTCWKPTGPFQKMKY